MFPLKKEVKIILCILAVFFISMALGLFLLAQIEPIETSLYTATNPLYIRGLLI